MLTRTDLRSTRLSACQLAQALPRATLGVTTIQATVAPLIEGIRRYGAAALHSAAERSDDVRFIHLRVPITVTTQALNDLDPAVREALGLPIAHSRVGYAAQVPVERSMEMVPGGTITRHWIPVEWMGLYVPGGLAVYPPNMVMDTVTAQVVGVKQIALANPPQAEFAGLSHPTILTAYTLLRVTEVHVVGGVQAIVMLACGTDVQDDIDRADAGGEVPCRGMDVATSPGSIYMAATKRAVMGMVGIDAGIRPTKIAVLADTGADPEHVAVDLFSQAEHDSNAGSILIADSPQLVDVVDTALKRRLGATRYRGRAPTTLRGSQSGTALVRDLAQTIEVTNVYAAGHLEIHASDTPGAARRIRNTGITFVGPYSPASPGDYLAGSSHALPVGGIARFAAGLNVMTPLKPVQPIEYNASALESMMPALEILADCEDLPIHGEAVRARGRWESLLSRSAEIIL